MFSGSAPAKIDEKGRLKVPSTYLTTLVSTHGRDVFVTSLTGESALIYPMPVWTDLLAKMAQVPSSNPSRRRFHERTNFFGAATELDAQGRLVVPYRLRDIAQLIGDVDVIGQPDFLDVWNHDRMMAKLNREPWSDADWAELARFGV